MTSDVFEPMPAGNVLVFRRRQPVQKRAQARMASVLVVAEQMLEREGPEATSIPDIAKLAGVPRASIYQFFPNKYVLFSYLAERHLARVATVLAEVGQGAKSLRWPELVRLLIDTASDYYHANPVAGLLLLGGPFSRASYLSQEWTNENIGQSLRRLMAELDQPVVLPVTPDAGTYAVEIAFALMKHSYCRDNLVSDLARFEATQAVVAYLKRWECSS